MAKRKKVGKPLPRFSNKGKVEKLSTATKERVVLYKEDSVRRCRGEDAISSTHAKQFLGWAEESKEDKFSSDFLLRDYYGTKIRCINDVTNRPLSMSKVLFLKQEVLRNKWHYNAETIIIGKTGLILNGQHQLIALVLASQEWNENKSQWEEFWPTEPTIEKLVAFGIDENDEVVNTMDTCKPRSLSDVIYRSKYFADLAKSDRNAISRITDYAVRFLWNRTGASQDAYSVRRTHSESLDFINRHPKIMECVKHIYEENGSDNNLKQFIPLGYAAGLLYLMGSCTSSSEKYKEETNESSLKWDMYDKASDFFVLLASGAKELNAVSTVLAKMLSQNENVSIKERWCLLIKTWNCYSKSKPVTSSAIELDYDLDSDGIKRLVDEPVIGGIDCDGEADIPPDELVERIASVRNKKQPLKKPKHKRKPSIGDNVWNHSTEKPYKAEVVEILGSNAKVKISNGYQGAGNIKAALLTDLVVD